MDSRAAFVKVMKTVVDVVQNRRHRSKEARVRLVRMFRVFVVLATAAYIFWFFFPYLSPFLANALYQEIQSTLGHYNGFGAALPVNHPLYYGTWFGLWLIASVSLMLFQNWARHLFLWLYAFAVVLMPFSGFTVQGPVENLLSQLIAVLDGAILAMAFFSPLAEHFRRTVPEDDAH